MNTLRISLMLVAAIAIGSAGQARAEAILNFDQLIDAGTISYDGEGGALEGSGIRFDTVSSSGTPTESGTVLYCVDGCFLNFETGANTAEGTSAGTGIWSWDGGGFFTMTGALNTAEDGSGTWIVGDGSTDVTILTGTFADGTVATSPATPLQVSGAGVDTKHANLIAFYSLGPDFEFATTEIATTPTFFANSGFTGTVTEADLTNTQVVPEPGTLALLGAGLAGLGWTGRRRRQSA